MQGGGENKREKRQRDMTESWNAEIKLLGQGRVIGVLAPLAL